MCADVIASFSSIGADIFDFVVVGPACLRKEGLVCGKELIRELMGSELMRNDMDLVDIARRIDLDGV